MKTQKKHYYLTGMTVATSLLAVAAFGAESPHDGSQSKLIKTYEKLRDAQAAKNCFMGKPSPGRVVDCLATDVNLAPSGAARAAAIQRIACGNAIADAVAVTVALPRICRVGAVAGGLIGAEVTANPTGAVPGAVVGCGATSLALITTALPSAADCLLATLDLRNEVNKERELQKQAGAKANGVLENAKAMQLQTDSNCHRAVGGVGPVTFENVSSTVNGYAMAARAYANIARDLPDNHQGHGEHFGGFHEAGDSVSHGDGHSSGSEGGSRGGEGGGNSGGCHEGCKDLGGGGCSCIE